MSHRLKEVREILKSFNLDGFLVPRRDEHQNEYVAPYAERLKWITGFTGSAGIAILLLEKAALFSDGRYVLQMAQEVNPEDFSCYHSSHLSPWDWLKSQAPSQGRMGYDPWLHTAAEVQKWTQTLPHLVFVPCTPNPLDQGWKDQPSRPSFPLEIYDLSHGGEASLDKQSVLYESLQKEEGDALILSSPASICWLLNLRGKDIPYTPVALLFLILFKEGGGILLIQGHEVPSRVKEWIGSSWEIVDLTEQEFPWKRLENLKVWVDKETAAVYIHQQLEKVNALCVPREDPCLRPKALKNQVEVQGAQLVHVQDGIALVRFMRWFEQQGEEITEIDCVEKLLEFRKKGALFREPSFPTIAGAGAHGAIIHYHPHPHSHKKIALQDMFLLDSGGQYQGGTTDVTRVLMRGIPSTEQKNHYTRVLKGHIALASLQFPSGVRGNEVDVLARQFLWQEGLDYDHGTGHGVGNCLSVHEGPQSISRGERGGIAFQPGMILSNEPGFYKEGAYGIRIENLMVVERVPSSSEGGESLEGKRHQEWLRFHVLTLVPLEKKLIETRLLTSQEKEWIEGYHQRIRETLFPFLEKEEKEWLSQATSPLDSSGKVLAEI